MISPDEQRLLAESTSRANALRDSADDHRILALVARHLDPITTGVFEPCLKDRHRFCPRNVFTQRPSTAFDGYPGVDVRHETCACRCHLVT